jgi:peptidoglycan/xylan/chitin deacetylase (PgdA/CDA1 family)
MKLEQIVDFLAEPRLPFHAHRWLRQQQPQPIEVRPRDEPVQLVLSFDVEQDFGSLGTPDRWSACEPFLDWLAEHTRVHGWRTTLFVQGSIVAPLAGQLRALAPSHEIGLHGYYHELWGRPLWFTPQEGTPVYLRRELLKEGIRAFEQAGLPRPRSFRAPNLVCDEATLGLLDAAGFRLDSSEAAFRGCLPLPTRWRAMSRIPVSARPAPTIRRRLGVPTWAAYDLLNMRGLLRLSDEDVLSLARDILAAQDAHGAPRHLVVLGHPWEFVDFGHPGCSASNMVRLEERVGLLQERLSARFATLADVDAACMSVSATLHSSVAERRA